MVVPRAGKSDAVRGISCRNYLIHMVLRILRCTSDVMKENCSSPSNEDTGGGENWTAGEHFPTPGLSLMSFDEQLR